MKNVVRVGFMAVIIGLFAGLAGINGASAAPDSGSSSGSSDMYLYPTYTPEPGGVIRVNVPAGKWYTCQAYSLTPPFVQATHPLPYMYSVGPAPMFFRFAPGADVAIHCVRPLWPLHEFYSSPGLVIVKAGL